MKKIFIILFLLITVNAYPANYYVDATTGSDGDDGLSEVNAWETISKVNGESFSAGDSILFNKGDTWREQLTIPDSGSDGSPITFGAYGTGDNPIINGADIVSTWSSTLTVGEYITDDFEDGDVTSDPTWSVTESGTGTVVVGTNYEQINDYGVQLAAPQNADVASIFHDWGDTVSEAWAGCYFKLKSDPSDDGNDSSTFFSLMQSTSNNVNIAVRSIGGTNTIEVQYIRLDSGSTSIAETFELTVDTWYWVSLHYVAAAGTGSVTLYVDGNQIGTVGSLTNNNKVIDGVDCRGDPGGSMSAIDMYFDYVLADDADITEGPGADTVWKATLTTEPYQVFFNGTKGTLVASAVACDGANEWYWDANILYVYSESDPDTAYTSPGIEASARRWCIYSSGKDYVTVDGIDTRYAGAIHSDCDNITINGGNYVNIKNLTTQYGYQDGICYQNAATYGTVDTVIAHHNGDVLNEGNGIAVNNAGADNYTIKDCTSYYNLGDGIVAHGDDVSAQDGPDSVTIQDSTCYSNGEQGIEIYMCTNCLVQRNTCYGNGLVQGSNGQGVALTSAEAKRNSGNVVRHNLIYNMHADASGISTYKDDGYEIYNNIVYGSGHYGIATTDYDGGAIYNNTIYDSGYSGIVVQTDSGDNVIIKNNIISTSAYTYGIRIYADAIGGYVSDYNCVYDTNFGREDSTSYSLANWRTETSQDANSIADDPPFSPGGYELDSDSPCIDTGVSLAGTVDNDYRGFPRPIGAGYDIGAYELGSNLNEATIYGATIY